MDLKGKKIGVALTGSFCTFEKIFKEMEKLAQLGGGYLPSFFQCFPEHREQIREAGGVHGTGGQNRGQGADMLH